MCIAIQLACKHDDALFRLSHSYPVLQRLIGFLYGSLLTGKACLMLVCLSLVLRYDGDIVTAAAAADVRPERASLGPDGAARSAFNKRQAVVRFLTRACGASPVVELALGIGIITFWFSSDQFPKVALPTAKERAHAHRGDQLFAGFIVCWICCVLTSLAFFFVASWHHSRVDWQIQMLLAEEQLAAVKRAPTVRLESRTGCPTGRSGDRPKQQQQQQQQRRRGRRERGEEEQEQHEQGNPTAFLAHRAHGSSSPSLSPRLTNRLSTLAEQTEPASSPVLAACVTVAPASATESSLSPASSTKSHFSMGLGPGGVLFEASLLAQRAAFEEMKRHRGDGAGGGGGDGGDNDDNDGDEVSRGQKELRRLTFAAFSWAGKQLGEGSSNPHSSDHMAAHVGTGGGGGTSEGKMEEGRSDLKQQQQQQHHETMKEKVRRHVSVSPHLLVHRSAPHKGPEERVKSPKVEEEPKLEVERTEREKDKLRVSPSYVDRDKRKDSTPISSAVSWDGSLCTDEAGYERIQSALGREGVEGKGGGGGGGEGEKVGERTDEGDDFATVPETFDVQFDVRTVHVGESHDAEISMGQPGTELCDVDGSDIATVVVLDQARRVASHVVDDDDDDDDGDGNTTNGQRGDRAVLHSRVPNNDSQKAMTSPLLTPLRAGPGPVAERSVSNYPFPSTPSPGPSMAPQLQQQQQQQRGQLLELPVPSTDNSVDSDQRHRQEAREHAENVLINAQARAPASPWTFGQPNTST
ncbi:hypothetical protein FA10DRAFT_286803 [Acaromyces ingoldii]|uniref:Uncharacterized protein n=1 Tax=Acaromyces ingoldii TaxID=215250 RepID=A0A316YH81_9BASI|nr:hypothetical protein FA10DRAFT_286803 [Acaromyces ingoldii]PWN88900.1 hypothetical protein FA10DRAFT_286803 [Acaromyces ingoldii]